MPIALQQIIPDAETLLAYEPEDLAAIVLECLNSLPANEKRLINPNNEFNTYNLQAYPHISRSSIQRALMEAWSCLVRDGFIAPDAEQGSSGWFFITRKGERITSVTDFEAYQKAGLLPKRLLHPTLQLKVWADFARGEYDTAVFKAFKEIEVAARNAGRFTLADLGVDLMRKAFKENDGPLTDNTLPISEQQAQAHLFAGAIGSYKNPGSHRNVSLTDPTDAVELILLASHLLRIIDSRKNNPGSVK